MVEKTIIRIEEQIRGNESLSAEKKQELLTLLGELKGEVSELSVTHGDDARSIAGYTETSVHEATRQEVNPELLKHSLDGLSLSVRQFEISHPRLIGLINNIGHTLWQLGI
jgi:hypothetical protein